MSNKTGYRPVGGAPKPQPLGSKVGWNPAQPIDRTKATTTQEPQAQQGRAESRSTSDTYFTKPGPTQIIYNGDRQWARVTLLLETAGPVAVGTSQQIVPVNSGKGLLLRTGEPMTFTIAKGTRLYIASTSVNRVARNVEAVPWLEQIAGILLRLGGGK